jgi:polyisoprenoid-binding protein YceI
MRPRAALIVLSALFAAALALGADTGAKVFRVDANHTVIGFKASTPLFDVPGRFDTYKVEIQGDPAAPAGAKIRVDLEARSIDTANKARDKHLRSGDFFDVAAYPDITFTGTQVERSGDTVKVHGTLAMHGQSRDLDLAFKAAEGVNGAGKATWSYRATLPLDRLAFGLGADSVAAKISLRKEVELDLLLVGFFEDPAAPAPPKPAHKPGKGSKP